ncbi:MAG: FHA domain-containing protein [Microthrixaceae bacterium]|jgi:pSer/pThr/pTyr-binding forkhead associated (FHA) protein
MSADGIVCPRCSLLNAAGANFCSACGAELPDDDERTTGSIPQIGVDVAGEGEVGQLVVTRGSTAGAKYALTDAITTIGRHPQSSVFLDDITVSRRHAEVLRSDDGTFVLRDVGSLNGTYLDGERVPEALLREGAQIQIGKFRLVFVIGELGGAA